MNLMALSDLASPWAVRVVATLRIADLIAAGVTDVATLAARSGADEDALHRVLRYLACRELFKETSPGVFALTDSARPLLSGHPLRLRDWFDLEGAGGRMDHVFSQLLAVVRTGKPGYPMLYGRELWQDTMDSPEIAESYDSLMAAHTQFVGPAVVSGYDWDSVGNVVDVGGGTGSLLTRLALANPRLRGTLVDLPEAAGAAAKGFARAGVADRCRAVAGSFFDPLPPGADVYLLSWVLHDWNDADTVRILRRCAEVAGRVVIVENLDTGEWPERATAMDLRLLVLFGGKERTPEQLDLLAGAAGLRQLSRSLLAGGISLLEYSR
ncbi:methyltransferase [Kibdelosporangium aridum]|uniref:O-methyltransferase n=1 Tax=Kibdelosporangium aridum TaxID=2030 RepID=A0A1W2BL47_KIBAR|nr:methyltransferase [Kibdelosporangium aridum]SMC73689.1 O-methyltransferase [Kibdelosporangium aridum]